MKLSNKFTAKTSLYIYYIALSDYLDFFVKNKIIKTLKQNKSLCDKN